MIGHLGLSHRARKSSTLRTSKRKTRHRCLGIRRRKRYRGWALTILWIRLFFLNSSVLFIRSPVLITRVHFPRLLIGMNFLSRL
jgi:hypothetical protein